MDTEKKIITITVDDKQIVCEPGELLIAAAERSGIFVPRFCWHPRMDPVGACRMCLVHLEGGPPKPQTACTTEVRDGMVVQTQFSNPDIQRAQEGVLEFLLINHPLDCPICDRGGECPLQDQTLDYGPAESRFIEPKRRFVKPVEISSLIKLDRERCILCYRCTRFCEEISGDTMIAAMQRGPKAYIYPFEGDSFDSYFSGNTVQICPVGALTSTPYRFEARPWDLNPAPSTCNLCASGCAITNDVRTADGRVVRVSARVDEDVNEEWLCDKGRYAYAYMSSEARLSAPLVRRDGDLQPVGWGEAFRVLTERLSQIGAASDGPAPTAVIVGGSLSDEDAYTAQKFARLALRTNSVDHRLEGGMDAGAILAPRLTYDELLAADHVLVVSSDLREELPVLWLRLRTAVYKRGLRLSILHPRAVALSEAASQHVRTLPGTDGAAAAAIAAILGRPIAAGAEAMAAAVGVPPADLQPLADALRDAARPVVLLGPRVAADPDAVRAWCAVADMVGAAITWTPRRAGERGALAAGAHPGLLPGWRRVDDAGAREEIERAWGASLPSAPGLDVSGMLGRARDGDLEALWIVGADVLNDVPDASLGAAALQGARFVVVQDVTRSEQMRYADVVLPAAAPAEREGTLTDWEGRRAATHPAVDPPGAARADYAILAEAALRLSAPIGCRTVADVRTELDGLLRDAPAVPAGAASVRVSVPATDAGYPLRLLSYRLLYDEGSRVAATPEIRPLTAEAFVELHPSDAAAAGIEDGAAVTVRSRHGAVNVRARVDAGIRPGVAFVPYRQPGATARDLMAIDDQTPGVRVERA